MALPNQKKEKLTPASKRLHNHPFITAWVSCDHRFVEIDAILRCIGGRPFTLPIAEVETEVPLTVALQLEAE